MAVLKRNGPWVMLAAATAALLIILLPATRPSASSTAMAAAASPAALAAAWLPQTYPPLDEMAAGRIASLRADAGLDDDVLAAANLTDAQLESVLAALRTWYEANTPGVVAMWSAAADQRALVRVYQSSISNGVDRSAELRAAESRLATLQTEYAALISGARTAALAGLSESQRTLMDLMHANRGMDMPYRVLALTADQKRDLAQARTRYGQRIGATRDGGAQSSAAEDFARERGAALGAANVQLIDNLAGYRAAASARVVSAVSRVLPVESEG